MAGNQESNNPSEDEPKEQSSAKVKTFSCPSCNASVTVRNPGQSMSAACSYCHSTIDITDENYCILSQYYSKITYTPKIELGTRGKIGGHLFEVIGYLVRTDKASEFYWEEYLLFNPYQGYRWLTCSNNHWNFVTPLKEEPTQIPSYLSYTSQDQVSINKEIYLLYYRGQASITYVLGEFYWKVETGNLVTMEDYICPPKMLSCEKNNAETIWSLSEYVQPDVVKKAFKIKQPLLPRSRRGPNEPSKATIAWKHVSILWVIFLALLSLIEVGHITHAENKTVFNSAYTFKPNYKLNDQTTPVFNVDKIISTIEIEVGATVNNSWFYLSGEFVNDKTGQAYPFERSVEFYHGVDSDGYWSEGGTTASVILPTIPSGKYYINYDAESGGFMDNQPRSFTITVKRDVPTYANFFWCLFFVSIFPALLWWTSRRDEVERWSDSYYTPYANSGDD